ncbi:outer membrane protein [Brachyspira hampsonii]|uniref:Tia invasion determinant n=1 Tax=Brachyspira hampsonii 30446 TaxID=1289135 RepID=A0A2U4FPU4_9SPIR|nr:tia invasion determinant [Brachyspira hampsonii]EKV57163.1 tia invasion determinant [Brachyspira hampsonii 30446]MBW5390327.1 tia invasion determinant [Brachyspira hampsonii]MBW5395654.1 tia invasion determinant [Brachyspira hampsonii]OEJ20754.1 tia invasion determinant [Brachyspira hampsonii]
MKFLIRKFLIISIFTACFTNMLMSMDIGAYLAPKFLFEIEDSGIEKENSSKNIQNLYIGGGLAIGYNFNVLHKYSTVRVEFEYLYRNPLPENVYVSPINTMQAHSFLAAAYYDFYFLYIDYNNPDSAISTFHNGKRPVMSVYAGFLIGGELDTYIINNNFEYNGLIKTSTYFNEFQFVYGFGGGLGFHITPLVSVDLGYRIILNTKTQSNHDIVASVRFNF